MISYKLISDKENWDKTIESFTHNDVYFFNGYFVPFKNYGDGEPHLFYFESENGKVAYPFMLRDISKSESLKNKIEQNKYFDISSAYGYGGPLFELSDHCNNLELLKIDFNSAFSDYCKSNNIITQFDRFHPILKNHLFFEDYSELSQIRKTVHIDLLDQETILGNMHYKCRNMMRKAEKNGVSVKLEESKDTLGKFIELYQSTMIRNQTTDYYLFSQKFFRDTINNLDDKIFIANAYFEDSIIASALIMKSKDYLHYHFSGSDVEYRNLQANNLLLYKVALWGSENGYDLFHLGGGFESETDPLFKFKKSFNKNEPNNFFIGKNIHDKDTYDQLIAKIGNKNNESTFFPKYRA